MEPPSVVTCCSVAVLQWIIVAEDEEVMQGSSLIVVVVFCEYGLLRINCSDDDIVEQATRCTLQYLVVF